MPLWLAASEADLLFMFVQQTADLSEVCFGHHERCSPDFCLSAKERSESSRVTSSDGAVGDGDTNHMDEADDPACKFSCKIRNRDK